MTPGLIAFFVIIAMLLAFYALLAPTNTKVRTPLGDEITPEGAEPTGLFERIVRPTVRNFLPQSPLSLTEYANKNEGVKALLARTGNPWRVTPEEYVAVRVLSVIFFTGIILLATTLQLIPIPWYFGLPMGLAVGYLFPKAMIDSQWGKRRRDIRQTLPEALDLLRICMNAGYNFSNALRETTELLPPGTTRDEMQRMSAEIAAGRTLDEALTSFAYRCPTEGVEAFVRAISQANTTGSDISDTLAYQSEETRAEYERVVETRAQKLQTTLFFPIIICLLPSLLLILFAQSITGLDALG